MALAMSAAAATGPVATATAAAAPAAGARRVVQYSRVKDDVLTIPPEQVGPHTASLTEWEEDVARP